MKCTIYSIILLVQRLVGHISTRSIYNSAINVVNCPINFGLASVQTCNCLPNVHMTYRKNDCCKREVSYKLT